MLQYYKHSLHLFAHMCTGGITDCYDALLQGHNESGVYSLQINNVTSPVDVFCDMETDGERWTVLLKRQDGSVDFYRNWADYKNGFGDLEGEHWLGLDPIYLLTHQCSNPPQLRVDLEDWEGNTSFAKYEQFSVSDEDSDYILTVSGYQPDSTAGDSLLNVDGYYTNSQNGQKFTTPDRDNDRAPWGNCAIEHHGSWWHKDCFFSLLTGKYQPHAGPWNTPPYGIAWYSWKNTYSYSMSAAEMKIRPRRD